MTSFIQELKITLSSPSKPLLEELRANAYGDLDIMMKSGIFNFRNGMAELHRDNEGKLRSVSIKEITYKN